MSGREPLDIDFLRTREGLNGLLVDRADSLRFLLLCTLIGFSRDVSERT